MDGACLDSSPVFEKDGTGTPSPKAGCSPCVGLGMPVVPMGFRGGIGGTPNGLGIHGRHGSGDDRGVEGGRVTREMGEGRDEVVELP